MTARAMASDYMHWAKNQPPVRYNLASSEVAHWPLDRLDLSIADLELTGASHHRYPPLREAIAAKCGVSPAHVVMANGASMANFLAMSALIEPGDDVLIEQPAYEPLLAAASHLGAEIVRFERRANTGFLADPEAIERALTPRTRLIILTNLHNPSSALIDTETLLRIDALAARADARVLIDEIFLDAAAEQQRSCIHLSERFVATGSLTKVFGLSGIRCGWILAAPDLVERMWRLNELMGVAQPHADERLGCIALAHLDRIRAGTPALLARNRALFNRFIAGRDDLECAPIEHGITAFPRLLRGDVDILHALLRDRYSTSIVPGRFFGSPDHFRAGIGAPTPALEAGLDRIGAALDALL